MKQKHKDFAAASFIYGSAFLTMAALAIILAFILYYGIPHINFHFLTAAYEDKTIYLSVPVEQSPSALEEIGLTGKFNNDGPWEISGTCPSSPISKARDEEGNLWNIEAGDKVIKVGSVNLEELRLSGNCERAMALTKGLSEIENGIVKIKICRTGGGIIPMAVTTLYMVILSLGAAMPIGIMAAIYLNEYARQGSILFLIRFAIQSLSGIPSILYGMFGFLFFVRFCRMGYSILAGAFTLSILLLPLIILAAEEAFKSVPAAYRESSLSLGASKFQTVQKIVLPNAFPGILTAVLLSVGRIVGESASLILTAGTVAQIPAALTGDGASAATLTVKAYTALKEKGDIGEACAIGIVLIVLVLLLNFILGCLKTLQENQNGRK